MTREQASEVIAMTLDKIATQIMGAEMMDNETRQGLEHTIRAFTMARTALREIDAMYATDNIGESTVETLKQACPYCSWIDPSLLEDDPEDGAQNYCQVCGRDLRR